MTRELAKSNLLWRRRRRGEGFSLLVEIEGIRSTRNTQEEREADFTWKEDMEGGQHQHQNQHQYQYQPQHQHQHQNQHQHQEAEEELFHK